MSELDLLPKLFEWVQANRPNLERQGVIVEILDEYVPASGYVQLITDRYIGRLTVWDFGNAHLEVLEIATERSMVDEHLVLRSSAMLTEACERFVDELRI